MVLDGLPAAPAAGGRAPAGTRGVVRLARVTVNGGALPLQTFAGVPSPVAGRVTSDIDIYRTDVRREGRNDEAGGLSVTK